LHQPGRHARGNHPVIITQGYRLRWTSLTPLHTPDSTKLPTVTTRNNSVVPAPPPKQRQYRHHGLSLRPNLTCKDNFAHHPGRATRPG
jgi:hypothetical protein